MECIEFSGQRNEGGYGYIPYADGVYMAHRMAWMLHNGKAIPKGKVVMHSCDNQGCINPVHLSLGTMKDNTQDMISKGRADHVIHSGRPVTITPEDIVAIDVLRKQGISVINACKQVGMSRHTYYNKSTRGFNS
jgi:hypothetical protein